MLEGDPASFHFRYDLSQVRGLQSFGDDTRIWSMNQNVPFVLETAVGPVPGTGQVWTIFYSQYGGMSDLVFSAQVRFVGDTRGHGPVARADTALFPVPFGDITDIHDDFLGALDTGALVLPDVLGLTMCPASDLPCDLGQGEVLLTLTEVTWSISEVPEPASAAQLSIGLAVLAFCFRRRRTWM